MKKHLFSIIVLLLLPIPLWGATISVCSSGCNYTSIQSAYNAANTGDIVEIRDSRTYLEAVNMNKSGTSSSLLHSEPHRVSHPPSVQLEDG
jgi:hypothetical protein